MRTSTARRNAARLAGAAVGIAALAALVWWALPDTAVHSPLWTQVIGWPAALLLRCDPVQRWIGSGRLENRVWLRVFLAGALFAATIAPTGVAFLFPVFAALVASVHLQWSGARAWRPCAAMTLTLSAALQVPVQAGWLPAPLSAPLELVAAVITTLLSLLVIGNIAVLAAQREAGSAALEAERRTRHDQLLHAATHDALTGQLNRAGLQEHFTQRLGGALPSTAGLPGAGPSGTWWDGSSSQESRAGFGIDAGSAIAVVYIDLDDFKPVNDRYGHAAGDELLRLAAQRLAGLLRPQDRLARLGGDEFVAVLATGEPDVVHAVATRAAGALQEPFDLGGTVVRISASIGTALSGEPGTDLDELLRRADAAMYAAKTARRR
ncbi:diguanylate cyclase domain-containing protein [Kineococcus sp. SYSU DK005]|uniref:diguanylate cyclase domain-containing protein n=1 Tax=Kineococcus sp. SYSU DK005 TaxID=3383126 RepID=UPI003D7CB80F